MSGVNGLLGYQGCCCDPAKGSCDADVDDFYLWGTTYPWQISIADFCARFTVDTAYFNMFARTPYSAYTQCGDRVDFEPGCCGGPSEKEICCDIPAPDCCDLDCTCATFPCYLCEPCTLTPTYTACNGNAGHFLSPDTEQDLNVDGDAFPYFCCDCVDIHGPVCCCRSISSLNPLFPGIGCYEPRPVVPICPNEDQGYPQIFSGLFDPLDSAFFSQQFLQIPCDNTSSSSFAAARLGEIINPMTSPSLEFGKLTWIHYIMDYQDDVESTTCDTLILRFNGQHEICNTGGTDTGLVFYAKKYMPTTNLVAAGDFVIGRYYKIKVVGTTNFVAIGAGTNTVGTIFQATGIGAGSGTAYLARNMNEIGSFFAGNYKIRSRLQNSLITETTDFDYGDLLYNGIERATQVNGDVGTCECNSINCVAASGSDGNCGSPISVSYPTCYNAYTDITPNLISVDAPLVVTITFT